MVVVGDIERDESFVAFMARCEGIRINDEFKRPVPMVPSFVQSSSDREWAYKVSVYDPTTSSSISIICTEK